MSWSCNAEPIARESFDYAPASNLSTLGGGNGWAGNWFQDGESVATGTVGLGYIDSLGNVLNASGLSALTSGSATTRSLRDFGSSAINDVWISFLYRLPATNSKFEGVTFYRGTQQVFSIYNPGSATNAAIYLANNLVTSTGTNTGRGVFGQTHCIVLKLTKGGGTGGADRIEAFIDPILSGLPTSPVATVNGSNFDFNRVRLAGEDGSALWVDELRIGESFAEVAPHMTAGDPDSDGDGLSNSQEALLGLDPNQSDAALISGIQAHPEWFGLYTASGILELGNGGTILPQASNEPVNLIFEVQQTDDLAQWDLLETINRQVELPPGKEFLRVNIETP